MLYTLHSYISRELAKAFTIAALSLTVVLSLGGLLQPLRQNGVSALQLFQFIIYMFPAMLTFSLPVAALLAATIVYGRLSADNELIACRASGISMWSLLLPGIVLGVLVLASNLMLSNWFIPGCAAQVEKIVRGNIQDIAFNKLRNDRQLSWKNIVITAEEVDRLADGRILLHRPAIIERARRPAPDENKPDAKSASREELPPARIIWCRRMTLEFDREANTVTIVPQDAIGLTWSQAGTPARVQEAALRFALQDIGRDQVSFRTYSQLMQLRKDPSPFTRVKRTLDKARRLIAQKLLCDEINEALSPRPGQQSRSYTMKYEMPGNPDVLLDARIDAPAAAWVKEGKIDDGLLLGLPDEPNSKVMVTLFGPPGADGRSQPTVVYSAAQARMTVQIRDDSIGPMIDVQFLGQYERRNLAIPGSPPATSPQGRMPERLLPAEQLTRRVASMTREQVEAMPLPANLRKTLTQDIERTRKEIAAELHSRAAFAVAGLVLVMLGAALGVIFRSGHVLVAFGIALIPALFAMMMVLMGSHVATNAKSSLQQFGAWLIWSGNVLLLGLNAWVYARLMKH